MPAPVISICGQVASIVVTHNTGLANRHTEAISSSIDGEDFVVDSRAPRLRRIDVAIAPAIVGICLE